QMQKEHAVEVEKLKKEAANLTRERDDAITVSSGLAEEKTTLEKEVEGLQVAVDASLDEGFSFALDRVRVLFPELDEHRLSEADAMKEIEDVKLVDATPPSAVDATISPAE
ncbi:hypothetical protein A2U01_0053329, partial [Trifolium medium]|nr:hypothetical protein [Trifolium medium]